MFSEVVNNTQFEPSSESLVNWCNDSHPDSRIRFQVMVPANLVVSQLDQRTPGPRLPGVNLVSFRDRLNDHEFEVLVQASWIKHEVSLRDYYQHWAKFDGETFLDSRLKDGNPDKVDLQTSRTIDDGQIWTTRRRGFKVGNGQAGFVLTINCACPLEQYSQQEAVIESVVNSFQLLTEPVHPFAEPLRLVTRREPVDFASYLPISWQEQPHNHDAPGPARFVFLRDLRGATSGVFSMVVSDKGKFPAREDFLREAVSTWEPLGIDLNQIAFEESASLGKAQTVRGTLAVQTRDGSTPKAYALEMLLADFGSHWFNAEVLGPSPEQDFEAWAINHRALDIFARQFRQA